MDEEEKELLKKLLKKVENLEKELAEAKKEKTEAPKKPKFGPMPRTNDRLANIIIRKARQKAMEEERYLQTPQGARTLPNPTVDEIRKDFHLGEVILFIKKHKIPIGNKEDTETGEDVIIKE